MGHSEWWKPPKLGGKSVNILGERNLLWHIPHCARVFASKPPADASTLAAVPQEDASPAVESDCDKVESKVKG